MEENKQNTNGVNEISEEPADNGVRTQMPHCLVLQVVKRIGCAILMALLTTIVIATSKNWSYAVGYLVMALLLYLGFDIVWKFRNGMIYVAKMVVCKAHRGRNFSVTVRSASVENVSTQTVETYKVYLNVPLRDRINITPGTLLNIYISETAPETALAYECLGEVSN